MNRATRRKRTRGACSLRLLGLSFGISIVLACTTQREQTRDVVAETKASTLGNEVGAVEFLAPESKPPKVEPTWRTVRVRLEGLPDVPETEAEENYEDCPVVAWDWFDTEGRRRADLEPISDGRISIDLRGDLRDAERLRLLSASWRGERFRPVAGGEWLALGTEGELVAQFERAPTTSLVVKHHVTGELLSTVELRLDGGDEPFSWAKECVIDPIYEERDKWSSITNQPIELESLVPAVLGQGGRVNWRVRSKGFAERCISVALGSGGTHELHLAPVASVQVKWYVPPVLAEVGVRSRLSMLVVLDPPSAADAQSRSEDVVRVLRPPALERLTPNCGSDSRGAYCWTNLPQVGAGEHELELRLARQFPVEETLLAKGRFVAIEGEDTEVELVSAFEADALPAKVGFDFLVPEDRDRVLWCEVTLQRAGVPGSSWNRSVLNFDPATGRTGSLLLSPGLYELDLRGGLTFHTEVTVTGGVTERRRIELPPLTRFRVQLVAAHDGVEALPEAFPWCARFGSANSRDFVAICETDRPGTFELSSPSEQIELKAPRDGSFYFADGGTCQLSGGGEHVVAVHRSPRVRLQLVRDGRRIAIPLGLRVVQRFCVDPPRGPTDNPPPQRVIRPAPGAPEELQLWFPGPGTYELQLSPLEGYAPLPRLRVRVAEHDDLAIEVPLEPKR